jgi:hypothetical protein
LLRYRQDGQTLAIDSDIHAAKVFNLKTGQLLHPREKLRLQVHYHQSKWAICDNKKSKHSFNCGIYILEIWSVVSLTAPSLEEMNLLGSLLLIAK